MQFLNPLFLIGLIAIAIPIIIHMFNFRRAKRVLFSNVAFLKSIQTQKRKTSQLKHLIILFLRIATIICIVLAFAKPFIPQKEKLRMEGMQKVVVYIDNSFSMQAASVNGHLLEDAKRKASEIVKAYKQTDKFCLLTNDLEGKHQRFVNAEDMLSFIDEVEYSSAVLPLSFIVKKSVEVNNEYAGEKKKVYLISDFQKSNSDIQNLPADSSVQNVWLVPVKGELSDNVYIDSVWFDSPFFFQGNPVMIQSRVVNSGKNAVEKIPVKLMVNGKQRALASVDLKAGESKIIPLHFTITESGILQAYVQITDYPVVFDDTYYFTLLIQKEFPVLLISGSGQKTDIDRLFTNDSAFHFTHVPENKIDYTRIPDQNLIILEGLQKMSTGLGNELETFVKEGGAILIIPSEKMDQSSYEQVFASLKIPFFTEFVEKENKVVSLNKESFLFKGVFEKIPDQMELPFVSAYYRIQIPRYSSTEKIMSLSGQDPFLTVTSVGKGKVYMMCVPLKNNVSNFSSQMLFVPTLYNMALFSRPASLQQYDINETQAIEIHTLSNEQDLVLKIRSLEGSEEVIPELKKREGIYYLFLKNQFKKAGNFNIIKGKEIISGLSLNYNRKESEREVYSINELENQLKKDEKSYIYEVIESVDKPMDVIIKKRYTQSTLWKWFILFSIVFMLMEILVHRFWKENTHTSL